MNDHQKDQCLRAIFNHFGYDASVGTLTVEQQRELWTEIEKITWCDVERAAVKGFKRYVMKNGGPLVFCLDEELFFESASGNHEHFEE